MHIHCEFCDMKSLQNIANKKKYSRTNDMHNVISCEFRTHTAANTRQRLLEGLR